MFPKCLPFCKRKKICGFVFVRNMLDNRKQKNVVVSEGVAYQHVPWESESCLSAHAKPETSP